MRKYLLLIICVFGSVLLQAQGLVVVPLRDNEAQRAQYENLQKLHTHGMLKKFVPDTTPLKLPFFDDFSYVDKWQIDTVYHGVYPYDELWMDHKVFVNSTMADSPPSIGVATFDGLDEQGRPYNAFANRASSAPADTLTSRPIALDSIPKLDSSLYLSFYYQPQGIGVAPKEQDTFTLEFKYKLRDTTIYHNPLHDIHGQDTFAWKHMWGVTGRADTAFKMVLIRVDSSFYYRNFQFRFVSYANTNGNLNHWHLDYVYLASQRSKKDTFMADEAISNLPTSVLSPYFAVPAKQFYGIKGDIRQELNPLISEVIKNSSNVDSVNTDYALSIVNLINNVSLLNLGGVSFATNIPRFGKFIFKEKLSTDSSLHTSAVPTTHDTILFLSTYNIVIHNVKANGYPQNDHSYRVQPLTRYFAYDDGSAEAGFGLINVQTGQIAVEYYMNVANVLQGVLIHFNQSEQDVSANSFSLMVWQNIDLSGTPGNTHDQLLLKVDNLTPQYTSWTNGDYYFEFDNPISLQTGTFYVGWMQNSDFVLNVGLDKNYDEISQGQPNTHIFYNVDGSWQRNSSIHGAPMIKPVIGAGPYQGISATKVAGISDILVYPNPGNGRFKISLPNNITCKATLYDLEGRALQTLEDLSGQPELDFSKHPAGIYLLRVNSDRQTWCKRIIIQ